MPELLFEIVYHFKRVEFHVKLALQFLWRFYLLRRLPYILMTFAVMIVGLHGLEEGKVLLLIVLKFRTFLIIALYLVKGRIPIDLLKMLEISHIGRTGGLPLLFDGQTFFGILDSSRLAVIVLVTFCLFSPHLEELIDMMRYLIFRNSQQFALVYFVMFRLYLVFVIVDLREDAYGSLSCDDVGQGYCVVVDFILVGPPVDRFFLIFRLLHMRFMIQIYQFLQNKAFFLCKRSQNTCGRFTTKILEHFYWLSALEKCSRRVCIMEMVINE